MTDPVLLTLTIQVVVPPEIADAFKNGEKRGVAQVRLRVWDKITAGDYQVDSFS